MYDYVIIGAGSAGCVLAARLTEDPDVTVCLVEAGPSDTADVIGVPAAFGQMFRTRLDWDYDTQEEAALDGRRVYLPRGRMIGGTSSLNGMVYIRGNHSDYDGWNQPGWSFRELLPYFKRSEDNERGESEFHGVGGPLAVSEGRSKNEMVAAFVEATTAAGLPENDDFNGATQEGFGSFQLTQKNGRRWSASDAFLRPALDRPNLTVKTHVQVSRITFDAGRATGIVGTHLDDEVTIGAEREVIVAAGVFNSPQLLMLSGIGASETLTSLGIPVVVDQPQVGANLQDHPQALLVYPHDEPLSLLISGEPRYQRQFEEEGTGPLTSNVVETGGFADLGFDGAGPDVQFHAGAIMFREGGLGAPTGHAISYGACVLRPRSRGTVTIASADPTAKPVISHNFYEEKADLEIAVEALRLGMDLARQRPLKRYTDTPLAPPASSRTADLETYIRRNTGTAFHPAGTCAMGTVVDAELRVRGVEGLRVVDASVMPVLIRGNTNAPVIAIAEKGADLIRGLAAPV